MAGKQHFRTTYAKQYFPTSPSWNDKLLPFASVSTARCGLSYSFDGRDLPILRDGNKVRWKISNKQVTWDREESALTPSGASSPRIEPSASNSEDDRGESPGQHPTTDEKGRRPGCDPAAGPNRIQRDPSKARPWNSLRAQKKKREKGR